MNNKKLNEIIAENKKECGPHNEEARRLIHALHKVVNTAHGYDDFCDDEFGYTGVGKDYLGKFAFANVKINGRVHRVTIRDIKDHEHEGKKLENFISLGDEVVRETTDYSIFKEPKKVILN